MTTSPANDDQPSPRAGIGGPRTPEGKARSAQNALKHGLRASRFVLLPDEDPEEFQALVADLTDDLRPVGRSEVELVAKIAIGLWKEIRGDRMEGEALARQGGGTGEGSLGAVMTRWCEGEHAVHRVVRYQGYASSQLWRGLAALKAMQAARRAEEGLRPPLAFPASPPPPPALTYETSAPTPPLEAAPDPAPESERTRPADAPAVTPSTAEVAAAPLSADEVAEQVAAELDALITGSAPPDGRPGRGVEELIGLAERYGILPEADPEASHEARAPDRRRARDDKGGPANADRRSSRRHAGGDRRRS